MYAHSSLLPLANWVALPMATLAPAAVKYMHVAINMLVVILKAL